jgi:hypothetical protein
MTPMYSYIRSAYHQQSAGVQTYAVMKRAPKMSGTYICPIIICMQRAVVYWFVFHFV